MATETITLSKQDTGTGLYLEDSEGHSGDGTITTTVGQGDTVVWELKKDGGIDEIVAITPKKDSQDIFSTDPAPKGEDGEWEGTVSDTAKGTESYTIKYKIGTETYSDDPDLEIHG